MVFWRPSIRRAIEGQREAGMRAMYYEAFEAVPEIRTLPDPTPG